MFDNFIVEGAIDSFKYIIETTIVPTTMQVTLILAIISRFTETPFPDLILFIWHIVFPRQLPYPANIKTGPMKIPLLNFENKTIGHFDIATMALIKA